MSIIAALHHVTHYHYDKPTQLGMQTIRLRPAAHARAQILSYSMKIEPGDHFINWQQDPFGNFLARVTFPEKITSLRIEVDLVTEVRVFNPFDFFLEDYAEDFPFAYPDDLKEELAPYLEVKEAGPKFDAWLSGIDRSPRRSIDFLVDINQQLNALLDYTVRMEPGVHTPDETLTLGRGSCRDMAWMLCQAMRRLGLATRFASGYLVQLAADVKSLDGPSGTTVDFTDLHAWCEVYLPGAGWVGLDPTSGLFAGEGHIPLCCTPSPSSAAPVTGTLEGGVRAKLEHEMTLTRVHEAPRVTKPYTDGDWRAIDALGKKIDKKLSAADVRLTMGGEPTFVSIDDRQDDAWHYAALGSNKKALAGDLLHRLRARFAPGGLVMFTEGKWYPGEILPRWALPCFWRRDGEALWTDSSLLADPESKPGTKKETAKRFLETLGHTLGIPPAYVLAAHEDAPYYLWKEQRLPIEDAVEAADLYESTERQRLQKLMDQGLGKAVGYVLPLGFSPTRARWISNRWRFRGPHMVLLAGDSPVGLRLPLGGLPTPEEAEDEILPERSPFEITDALPSAASLKKRFKTYQALDDKAFRDDPTGLIKTAICAEVRRGVLHLFLPPLAYGEHAVELLAAVEATARTLATPVVLEGYTPPGDPRLNHFSVTPDPGVIEVNVQPAADWQELKDIVDAVYSEARLARLSAEKFMIDGRRTGTGGGNHLVLGAAAAADSPFLRRPDLLKSMILFWQNHPALSYVFSGSYIGPTSQAPRIDEARHESLYELEIAFDQFPGAGDEVQPWLVDRLLRNLLVDLTGNTHRAEFCIDKLYSPDSARGRLGLLEMRGFEMPPHPQMSLVQLLLLRAVVAAFWNKPYPGRLIRWGTALHDKFMLPTFLREDLHSALADLRHMGFDLSPDWFEPFFTFRFPQCGTVQIGSATLSLYSALEPWPVMGEEPTGGGVSRTVDASVERLELSVRGLAGERYAVTCNGRRIPLSPTADKDLLVAGIRFKAWSQPSSLHPKLPVQAPLVFDVIDTVLERSIGGCTYHVAHPGGRAHETYPVNENEAEGRRLARFEAMGHTPGRIRLPRHESNPEYPHTLDLRRSV